MLPQPSAPIVRSQQPKIKSPVAMQRRNRPGNTFQRRIEHRIHIRHRLSFEPFAVRSPIPSADRPLAYLVYRHLRPPIPRPDQRVGIARFQLKRRNIAARVLGHQPLRNRGVPPTVPQPPVDLRANLHRQLPDLPAHRNRPTFWTCPPSRFLMSVFSLHAGDPTPRPETP